MSLVKVDNHVTKFNYCIPVFRQKDRTSKDGSSCNTLFMRCLEYLADSDDGITDRLKTVYPPKTSFYGGYNELKHWTAKPLTRWVG